MRACPRRPAPRPSAPSRLRACAPRPLRTCTWTSRASPRGARPSSACPPRPRSAGRPRRGGDPARRRHARGSRPACAPAAAPASPARPRRLPASSRPRRPWRRGRRPLLSRASEPRTSRRSRPTRRRRRACVPERLWPRRKSRRLVRMGLDIRYARSGAVSIAYQVVGEGDTDLLFVPDFVSNLVYAWESPHWREFYERLARSFRLILFDKRGTGLSDLGGQFPSLETRMDDVRAVLDATGSASAVLLGSHDGCSMAALYAATYPERTRALVLFHPVVHHPEGQSEQPRIELSKLR